MKKLLLLTFAISAVSFAKPAVNPVQSDKMNITATIIQPLTVEADANGMAFGQVIQGSTSTASSKYTIIGQPGEDILVTIPESTTIKNGDHTLDVTITRTLPTNLGDGSIEVPVGGSITVPSDAPVGGYSGTLTATVLYN